MGALYRLIFPNGKSYIGITTQCPKVRFAHHVKDAQRKNPRGLLGRAIKEGQSPKIEVLLQANDWAYLVLMEKAAIAAFKTCKPLGYNNSIGGEGSRGHPRDKKPRSVLKRTRPKYPKSALPGMIRDMVGYDPASGEFWWKSPSSRKIRAGTPAGHVAKFERRGRVSRYLVIRVHYSLFLAHRIAWLVYYGVMPPGIVDHIDGNTLNNKIDNLRLASGSQNCQNTRRRSDNKSGYKGVSWDGINAKWVARIRIPGGKYKNLGRYATPLEAHRAYQVAANETFGEFARVS